MQFIEVNKISRVSLKAKDGSVVKDERGRELKGDPKIVQEIIRLDEIKSMRKWHKTQKDEPFFEKDIIILYMYGNKEKEAKGNVAQIHIHEDYKQFAIRAGIITLN